MPLGVEDFLQKSRWSILADASYKNVVMKALGICMALVTAIPAVSLAQVGRTVEDCRRAYGHDTKEVQAGDTVIRKFHSGGFEIAIFFKEFGNPHLQRAFRISYKKMPSDWSPEVKEWKGAHIPEDQLLQLLSANTASGQWAGSREEGFRSGNGTLIGNFDPNTNELVVEKTFP
jgi:hypothetical protein